MDRHVHHHDKQQLTFRSVQRDHPNNEAQFGCITMLKQCWERHGQVRLQLLMHPSFQNLVFHAQSVSIRLVQNADVLYSSALAARVHALMIRMSDRCACMDQGCQ